MKSTVFIQSIPHYPTSWGDATNSWNLGSYFTGMAVWHTKEFTQQLGVWNKQSYNINSLVTTRAKFINRLYLVFL